MRKRILLPNLLALALSLTALAPAQTGGNVTRIVILPFNVSEGGEAYVFGLAAALQRSLNTIDGWYVPPIGDAALLSNRVQATGLDVTATLTELFDADVIISGQARGGNNPAANLFFVGPGAGEPRAGAVAADETPAALVAASVDAILMALGKTLSVSERQELDRMIDQTPSLPSLGVVALASTGLPGVQTSDLAIATELDPTSSWVRSEYARQLLRDGRADEALFSALQATELLPSDPESWTVYGVALLAVDRLDDAVSAFERALRLNPSHALARAGLGNARTSTDDLEAATDIYPRLLDAYLSRAAVEADLSRSLQILRRAGRYLPESVTLHRSAIARAINAGDGAGASTYLEAAVATPLGASPALYALADVLPADQAPAAWALIEGGLERFPESPELIRLAARFELNAGDLDAARARLEPVNAGAPNDPTTANLLALVLTRQGEIDAAMEVLTNVAGDNLAVQLNFSVLLLEAGRSREALAILEPAAADTEDARIRTYYGIALSQTGRVADAEAVLNDVLDRDPRFELAQRAQTILREQAELTGEEAVVFAGEAGEAFDRGIFALQKNDLESANEAFGEARSFDDHPLLAFYHGYTLLLTNRPREAVGAYQRASEGFPDSDTVHNNYGYAFLRVGRLDRALAEVRTAITLNDQNARAHLNLGLIMFELNRFTDAIGAWNRAVAIDSDLENEIAELRQQAEAAAQP